MLKSQPYKLKNTIQNYKWGTMGKNAFIPKLLNIKADKDKPYAELWMGAHPKAPSQILIDGKEHDLNEIIRQYPGEMLGSKVSKRFSGTLPFLFKVLSANEALSIQVHP
ncbi:MAG TPA: mannose-6-phosphate isomerase, class I, partial [Ignavibacteriales bacterium]|nr:mannose-6-phosphate isomerase, class I [Ignavibacteriales bacterium]